MRKIILGILLTGCLLFSASTTAQVDMATARALAKQQGYTDSQIDAMINTQKQSMPSTDADVISNSVDRKDAQIVETPSTSAIDDKSNIFGHDMFTNKNSAFFPSYNIPTPSNYKLASGDQIVINIWGDVIKNITATISPEGSITVPDYGPIYLNGMTVDQANKTIKRNLSQIYAGLSDGSINMDVTLGKMRSVTINVAGDVQAPGSYTLPSLATMETALYMAGGPTELGTVRNIKLYRNNKLAGTFDLYDYIFKGKLNTNLRLEDNDIIIVGSYDKIVSISGNIKRPMRYELKSGETIKDIIGYAGGFNQTAYTGNVNVVRTKGEMYSTFDVNKQEFASFKLDDGDAVSVRSNLDRNQNLISISGAVWYPGRYALDAKTATLHQLIMQAGGLVEDAYTGRGIIYRTDALQQKQAVGFDVNLLMNGGKDIPLQKFDSVEIKFAPDMANTYTVSIGGEVKKPSVVDFREGMTVNDLIFMADSLTDAGQLSNIEVSRKIRNKTISKEELKNNDTIAQTIRLDLLNHPKDGTFKLAPFDKVYVRRAPGYLPSEEVTVKGEVYYPGAYTLTKNVVHLSDIIGQAQGLKNDAFANGATLLRKATAEEKETLRKAMEMGQNRIDTLAKTTIDSSAINGSYYVAINLKQALENPGQAADIVLKDGDVINIPKQTTTVRIDGAVLRPGVVTYVKGKSLNYYIGKAGGTTKYAWKRKAYVVSMNGTVYTNHSSDFKLEPGCEIIVPEKAPNPNRLGLASYLSIGTSITSMATMVIYLVKALQ